MLHGIEILAGGQLDAERAAQVIIVTMQRVAELLVILIHMLRDELERIVVVVGGVENAIAIDLVDATKVVVTVGKVTGEATIVVGDRGKLTGFISVTRLIALGSIEVEPGPLSRAETTGSSVAVVGSLIIIVALIGKPPAMGVVVPTGNSRPSGRESWFGVESVPFMPGTFLSASPPAKSAPTAPPSYTPPPQVESALPVQSSQASSKE